MYENSTFCTKSIQSTFSNKKQKNTVNSTSVKFLPKFSYLSSLNFALKLGC